MNMLEAICTYLASKLQHGLEEYVFKKIVTRMYLASPRDGEKFFLRLLLLHVPGATSFRDLRTVEGEFFGTFKEACVRLRLLDDDNELQATLREATAYQMPRQLLNMFALMCVFNE